MLKKAVPYHPVLMRPAQRMSHHMIKASNNSYVQSATESGFTKIGKHYGR